MFVFTAKMSKKKIVTGLILAGAAIATLVFCIGRDTTNAIEKDEINTLSSADFKNIRTDEERIAFLAKAGWEVRSGATEEKQVMIPKEFDQTYEEYNALQMENGMDLTKYAGKTAVRYTYEVTNYPTGETGVIAHLVIYRNRVIAADICSPKLDGFMHGLVMPQESFYPSSDAINDELSVEDTAQTDVTDEGEIVEETSDGSTENIIVNMD